MIRKTPAFWSLALLFAASAFAQNEEADRTRFKQVCRVKANGDVDVTSDIILSVRAYTQKRKTITNTSVLLRTLGLAGEYNEMKDSKAEFDDDHHAIRVTYTLAGGMRNHGKDWLGEFREAEKFEVIRVHPDSIVLLAVSQSDPGGLWVGTVRVEFPPGTRNIRFDPTRGGVLAEMPPPVSQPQGTVEHDVDLQVRPEIMSCFYKLYGNRAFRRLWVARTVFRNRGTATLKDFQVRYRIPNYADWSPWQRTAFVYPSQTVVEPYYPIFLPNVRELTSATPATVELAWSYRTPDGRPVEDNETRRIDILGLNDVIYSSHPAEENVNWFDAFDYSPLIGATFVTHSDWVIQRFAGMAAGMAGGVPASGNRQNAMTFMKAVYDLMVHNQIKYQSPPGLFKHGVRQHVKFGRDVLRNRSGTCIDLAILYASACQSGGLDPLLVMLPGHCYPIIRLPDGSLQAVETTCVSGTPTNQKIPFEAAVERGNKEWNDCKDDGTYYLVDIKKLLTQGVQTPDLPGLLPSALSDWGITAPGGLPAPIRTEPAKVPLPPAPAGYKRVADTSGASNLIVPQDWSVTTQGPGLAAADPQRKAELVLTTIAKLAPSMEMFLQAAVTSWKQNVPHWKETSRETLAISGIPAAHVRATGKPGGVDMTADYYLALSDQFQFLLMLSCPTSDLARWAEPLKRIAESWQIRRQDGAASPEPPKQDTPKAAPGLKRLTDPSNTFAFTVPEGWPIQQEPGSLLACDPQGKGAASCSAAPPKFQDLAPYVDSMIATWKGQMADWKEVRRSPTQVSGRPALAIQATGKHEGEAMAMDYAVALTAKHQLALIIAYPAAEAAQWADLARRIAASWELLDSSPAPRPTEPAPTPRPADQTAPPPRGWQRVADPQGACAYSVPEGWQAVGGGGFSPPAPEGRPEGRTTNPEVTCLAAPREAQTLDQFAQARTAQWRQSVPQWDESSRQPAQLAGRPALLVRALGRPNGIKTSFACYLLLTERHQIVLTLRCAIGLLPQWQEALGQIVQSFELR